MLRFRSVLLCLQSCLIFLTVMTASCSSNQTVKSPNPAVIKVGVKTMCPVPLQKIARADTQISAENSVDIHAKITANLAQKIMVKDGQSVQNGDVLVQLSDDGASKNQLNNAQIQATQKLNDYQKAKELFKQGVKTQDELDTSRIASEAAALQLHQAQIAFSKLTIKAPFSGKVSSELTLSQGALITPDMVLMKIIDPNTLRIEYALPERWFIDTNINQPVQVYSADGRSLIATGHSTSKSASVDAQTGSFTVASAIKALKKEGAFIGESVIVNQLVGKPSSGFSVPILSVRTDASGFSVYVIKDKHAHQVSVSLGSQHGTQVDVLRGLKTGDQVVVQGQLQLHDGALVSVTNRVAKTECQA
jgi:membrane fusion protein, multidrug efflux system